MSIKGCHIDGTANVPFPMLVNLYGCTIREGAFVGPFVEIQEGVVVGLNSRIQSHTFICSGVSIGNDVFVGHGVIFINDRHPRVNNPDYSSEVTIVQDDVSIGSGAIIMCGVILGKGSVIGAGALVLEDVPPRATVVGSPARILEEKS